MATSPEQIESGSGDRWRMVLLVVLLAALLIALPLMFVHPALVISLVWLGLVVLGAAWAIHVVAGWVHHRRAPRNED